MKLPGRKQKQAPPDRPFAHTDDCGIVRANPDAQIEWSYVGDRRWERVCRCGREDWYEPAATRARLDPLDPKNSLHAPQCEFNSATDPAVLRVLLKVTDKGDYAWVQCGGCDCGWQVPYHAKSIGGTAMSADQGWRSGLVGQPERWLARRRFDSGSGAGVARSLGSDSLTRGTRSRSRWVCRLSSPLHRRRR